MELLLPESEIPPHLMEYFEPLQANLISVLAVNTNKFRGAHFAPYAEHLVLPCILATCPEDGSVLDPFCGSGTTGVVALKNRRHFVGIELVPSSAQLAKEQCQATAAVTGKERPALGA
jgi:site-specific DNA-methyltransferase (adenine-specific)